VGWQKAMLLWFQGKAEVLEHHELEVRSVTRSFRLPSVLRLIHFVSRRPKPTIRFCRENIYIRDDFRCQYCAEIYQTRDLTLDHVFPVSRGGRKEWSNIVTACRDCNQVKGNRTPDEAGMRLVKKPVTPKWLPQSDFSVSLSTTPTTWQIYLRFETG
jgi:5-methylcytosine-specific restriction endonuclease McrA